MTDIATIILPCEAIEVDGVRIQPKIYCEYQFVQKKFNIDRKKYDYVIIVEDKHYIVEEEKVALGCLNLSDRRTIGQVGQDEERERYFVPDMKKQTLEAIGIDIAADERTDYNGRFLQKFIDKYDKVSKD